MLSFRKATLDDLKLYFDWANDSSVRKQSYNTKNIDFENHQKWFENKVEDQSCLMLIFQNEENTNVGQIRIQKINEKEALIGISIALEHRGKGLAKEMLFMATNYFLENNKDYLINAYIKEQNKSSKVAFEKAGFELINKIIYENCNSFHYIKKSRNANK